MLVFKGLIDCVFLLMHMVIILLMKIHMKDIFFQDLKKKKCNIEIEIVMTIRLIIQWTNTMKSEKYQQGCLLDFAYFEKSYRLIAPYLIKQKALDADSRAI